MRRILKTAAAGLIGLVLVTGADLALAQTYPNKPIRWIVGYPAGGAADFLARSLSQKMGPELGQPFVVENRPGAAGIIGMEAVVRSAPDGYTMAAVGNGELVYNQVFYKKLPYDPVKDFALIGLVAKIPFVLAVNASITAKNVGEFVALAKSQPGKLSYASGGIGHPNHLAMELFKQRTGIDLVNVAYRGMAPALQDFVGGNVPIIFLDLATGLAQVKGGKARVLGVSTKDRLEAVPDVPTLAESGIADYDVYAWQGLAFPAGTPGEVVKRMNEVLVRALRAPDIVQRFRGAGLEVLTSTPEQFADMLSSDRERWHPLIRSLGISLD